MNLSRFRPSPAMLVAIIALVVAASGAAVALPGENRINSGDVRNNSLRGVDLKNNKVTGRDVRESSLRQVPSAANGVKGIATISANGTVFEAQSLNVTQANVVKPPGTTGAFCFTGLPFNPIAAVAQLRNFSLGGNTDAGVFPDNLGTVCSPVPDTSARVQTYNTDSSGSVAADLPFTVFFF